ncbi:MAG: phosphate/phosphite/phosphonate ABC transporter substrate-binding protein [Pseudomonadota bacterium]
MKPEPGITPGFLAALFRAAGLILLFSIAPGVGEALAGDAGRAYSVGVVPQFEVRRIQEIWQPIVAEVSRRSGVKLELKTSSGIVEFERDLESGRFDFAYINPYHVVFLTGENRYLPLARDVEHPLKGIVVVRKDSPIRTMSDLNGKTIAFPSPNALGAALIPRAEFEEIFKISYKAVYVRSHSSVYLNVFLKLADAGGGVQNTLAGQKKEVIDGLRILHETLDIPPHPVAAHVRTPAAVRERVKAAFLSLGRDPGGKDLLAQVPIGEVGPAALEDYGPLQALGLEKYYVRE